MKVLLTNNTLAYRQGSELYVRDVAMGLLERGHTPIAYSTVLGDVAEELRRATVPVVDDLGALSSPPDVIHGHHHVETMTALLHFPRVPAVYFCHGWIPWEEMPPRFPRIYRYVAVDDVCRDRLVCENGIPEERVEVLLNFVDLKRFEPGPPLPLRPRRALVFSNNATEDGNLPAIRRACAQSGLQLDVIGLGVGAPCSRPEEALGGYDLVFAKARAALEAAAVGAAVVLCDSAGLGPMVTAADLDRLRRLNFGIRCLREPITAQGLLREMGRYDPADAAEVTRRIRQAAGREAILDRLTALYQEVIDAHANGGGDDPDANSRAASAYLRRISPVYRECSPATLREECMQLRSALAIANEAARQSQRECADLRRARESIRQSAAFGLRAMLLRAPLLGRGARALARLVRRHAAQQEKME